MTIELVDCLYILPQLDDEGARLSLQPSRVAAEVVDKTGHGADVRASPCARRARSSGLSEATTFSICICRPSITKIAGTTLNPKFSRPAADNLQRRPAGASES